MEGVDAEATALLPNTGAGALAGAEAPKLNAGEDPGAEFTAPNENTGADAAEVAAPASAGAAAPKVNVVAGVVAGWLAAENSPVEGPEAVSAAESVPGGAPKEKVGADTVLEGCITDPREASLMASSAAAVALDACDWFAARNPAPQPDAAGAVSAAGVGSACFVAGVASAGFPPKLNVTAVLWVGVAFFSISFSMAFAAALLADWFCCKNAVPHPDDAAAEPARPGTGVLVTTGEVSGEAVEIIGLAGLSAAVLPKSKVRPDEDFFCSISFWTAAAVSCAVAAFAARKAAPQPPEDGAGAGVGSALCTPAAVSGSSSSSSSGRGIAAASLTVFSAISCRTRHTHISRGHC